MKTEFLDSAQVAECHKQQESAVEGEEEEKRRAATAMGPRGPPRLFTEQRSECAERVTK